jgi:uncharacterized membrane protein YtjA (UPF0391 family)
MYRWIYLFLMISIVAAVLGFGGIDAGAAIIGKTLFYIFIVLFLISIMFGGSVSRKDI